MRKTAYKMLQVLQNYKAASIFLTSIPRPPPHFLTPPPLRQSYACNADLPIICHCIPYIASRGNTRVKWCHVTATVALFHMPSDRCTVAQHHIYMVTLQGLEHKGAANIWVEGCCVNTENDFANKDMKHRERVTFTLQVYAQGQRVPLQHLSSFIIQLATCSWPSSLLSNGQ